MFRGNSQGGRRFVTEAALIRSSPHSLKSGSRHDSLNVSRDVTFPPSSRKGSLEHSSFHVWLCAGDPMISRRERTAAVEGGRWLGAGAFWGERERERQKVRQGNALRLACVAAKSSCFFYFLFCKLLLCLLRKALTWTSERRSPGSLSSVEFLSLLWIWLEWGEKVGPYISVTFTLIAQNMYIHAQI